MEFFGKIENRDDLVNKDYITDYVKKGELSIVKYGESGNGQVVYTGNQSTNTNIIFKEGDGISISRNNSTLTFSRSNDFNTVNTVVSLPVDKRNCVATISSNSTLSFSNVSSYDGFEMNLYVLANPSTNGSTITMTINRYTSSYATYPNEDKTYPVIYNGVYDSSENHTINLSYLVEVKEEVTTILGINAATFHIFFDGEHIFINRLETPSSETPTESDKE